MWEEIKAGLEKKATALASAASYDEEIATLEKDAATKEQLAARLRKEEKDLRAQADGESGGDRSGLIRDANATSRGAQALETAAQKKRSEAELLRQNKAADESRVNALQKEIEEREKINQASYSGRQQLERERAQKTDIFAERDKRGTINTQRIQTAEEQRKARKAERESLSDRIPKAEEDLDRTATRNRDRILNSPQARNGPNADMLRDLGKAIGDADKTAEIEKIREQLSGMGGNTVAALREMLAAQERMAKDIENMRERIRKL